MAKRDMKEKKATVPEKAVARMPVAKLPVAKPLVADIETATNDRNGGSSNDRLDNLKSVLAQGRKSRKQDDEEDRPILPPPVSLGPAGAIVDALINTSPEKLLELTDFDRNQVALVPQVVVIDDMWDHLEQVLFYRSDSAQYGKVYRRKSPETPDTSGKFVHVLAQCRRSLGGKMKKALEDMALAELETRSNEEVGGVGGHDFDD